MAPRPSRASTGGARAATHRPTVLGRYRLGELIGHGATARVYRAHDTRGSGEVAIKEIVLQEGLERRVRAEVRAAARLCHPAIARLYDWGREDSTVYMAWELVEGAPLSELLAGRRRPGPTRMALIMADVLEGLAHAHARGVVHRDVKPANVLVGDDGLARLADFGVARLVDEGRLTRSGVTVGTMAYMAPEQARGREATGATDVFAACLVLYEGLSGVNPLAAGNPAETARRAAGARILPLAAVCPDVPRALAALVMSGLSPDPAARPSAAALARALRAGARRMAAPGRRLPGGPPAGARAAAVALAGTIVVALAGAVGGAAVAVPAAAVAAAVAVVAAPAAAAVLIALTALLALAGAAPAAAWGAGLAAAAITFPVRRHPRLLLVPALAPVAFLGGFGVMHALLAGALRGRGRRAWAAASGGATALGCQLWLGGHGLLFLDVPVRGHRAGLLRPLREHPAAAVGVLLLVGAALAVPAVARRRGPARALRPLAWGLALALTALALPGVGGPASVMPPLAWAFLGVWTLLASRRLGRRAPLRASGTLDPV